MNISDINLPEISKPKVDEECFIDDIIEANNSARWLLHRCASLTPDRNIEM